MERSVLRRQGRASLHYRRARDGVQTIRRQSHAYRSRRRHLQYCKEPGGDLPTFTHNGVQGIRTENNPADERQPGPRKHGHKRIRPESSGTGAQTKSTAVFNVGLQLHPVLPLTMATATMGP